MDENGFWVRKTKQYLVYFVLVLALVKNVDIHTRDITVKQKRTCIKYIIFNQLEVFYEIFNNISTTSYIVKQGETCIVDIIVST